MKLKYLSMLFVLFLLVISACKQQEVQAPTTDNKENTQIVMPIEELSDSMQKDQEMIKEEIKTTSPTTIPETPKITTLTVKGDDYTLDPKVVQVTKGSLVKITFVVSKDNVYYGGLDFRSDKGNYFNTGKILPGGSKEVTFTADQSFSYTSYWPSSGVVKATGQINVI